MRKFYQQKKLLTKQSFHKKKFLKTKLSKNVLIYKKDFNR